MAYSSGDAADQMVKMTLEGIEFVARLSGDGAKNLATFLFAVLSGEKQTKGKARLENLLRNDKELKVFAVKKEDEKRFTHMAKKYGVLFCAVHDRKETDGMTDIIVRASDAPRVNRLIERLNLATVDMAKIEMEMSEKAESAHETPAQKSPDAFLEDIIKKPDKQKEQPIVQNPTIGTVMTPPSENFSAPKDDEKATSKLSSSRTSIRKELNQIKSSAAEDKRPEQNKSQHRSAGKSPKKAASQTGVSKPKTKSTPKKEK